MTPPLTLDAHPASLAVACLAAAGHRQVVRVYQVRVASLRVTGRPQ